MKMSKTKPKIHFAVLTVSDSCSTGKAVDSSGPKLIRMIQDSLNCPNFSLMTVPDEKDVIKNKLIFFCDKRKVDAVFTTGGTGFGPRDVTPEATREVITREAPQLALAMTLKSLEKTKFAVLSRAVCGVRGHTLIVNLPGSEKAVEECFSSIVDVLPHIIQLLRNDLPKVQETHSEIQSESAHVCPHATGTGGDDRNSKFEMLNVDVALAKIFETIPVSSSRKKQSGVQIPPFRASIKDGYAVKVSGEKGLKKVIGCIAAGDQIIKTDFDDDSCYKINTGAPVPDFADAIVQIEDTKLIASVDEVETEIELLVTPQLNLDIRPIGSDLNIGEDVFEYQFPLTAVEKSLCASIGESGYEEKGLKIAIISTGDELIDPASTLDAETISGKIFDSNTTMLKELLLSFGFGNCQISQQVVKDDFDSLNEKVEELTKESHVIICTGGVSMGDKDFVKPVLTSLGYEIVFGRVNMKPGKPLTYAVNKDTKFFGLPGNPVSAFVTFHLFVLPALRRYLNFINSASLPDAKCHLPAITVELLTDKYDLDTRPEYARASIVSKNGVLYAKITGKQISSRLKSIVEADVLLHLPKRTDSQPFVSSGKKLKASVLKLDFISKYED